jgi:Holliday junction DNA helicase RuvA
MIGSLDGKVELRDGATLLVNVNGVGYKISVTSEVLEKTKAGESIKVYTYTYVKEDALELFGFYSFEDLKLFEKIIAISGIGPKTALNIFSVGTREGIVEAIIKGDVDFFTSVPRLGRKNAQKLIIELKSKLGSLEELDLSETSDGESGEVVTALKSFGFTTKEAQEALRAVGKDAETTEKKIMLALKYLGK